MSSSSSSASNLGKRQRWTEIKSREHEDKDRDDHEYYNVTINNNTSSPIPARFVDNRNAPLLHNPSNFHMCVIRFSIPAMLIPIFNFLNNTYVVSVIYNGLGYTAPVVYNDVYSLNDPSNQPIFSYNSFIQAINQSIYAATQAAITAGLAKVYAPFLGYSAATGLITLYTPAAWVPTAPGFAGITLMFNDALYSFFGNFCVFTSADSSGLTNGTGWNGFNLNAQGNNFTGNPVVWNPQDLTTDTWQPYYITQEFDSLYLWNAVRRIVFTSGSVAVKGEYVPTATSSASNSASQQILTDFEPSLSSGTDGRSYYQYVPTVLRFLDLTGNTPMTTFDLQVYWADNLQNLYPLMIPPNNVLTCKLQFTKKYQTVN